MHHQAVEQLSDVSAEATQTSGKSSETEVFFDEFIKGRGGFFMCRRKGLSL